MQLPAAAWPLSFPKMDVASTETSPSFNSPPFCVEAYESDLQTMHAAASQVEARRNAGPKAEPAALRKLDRFEVKDSDDEDLGSAEELDLEEGEEEEEEDDSTVKKRPAKKGGRKDKAKKSKKKKTSGSDEPDKKNKKDYDDDDEESDEDEAPVMLCSLHAVYIPVDVTVQHYAYRSTGTQERPRPRTWQEESVEGIQAQVLEEERKQKETRFEEKEEQEGQATCRNGRQPPRDDASTSPGPIVHLRRENHVNLRS